MKSPVDFAVGIVRGLEGKVGAQPMSDALEGLGQRLFAPPSVKGWNGGTQWINSTQTQLSALRPSSVRNRFPGIVTRVLRGDVAAQVEVQSGPHRFVSLLTREAVDDLNLQPGDRAVATVKSTNVAVDLP